MHALSARHLDIVEPSQHQRLQQLAAYAARTNHQDCRGAVSEQRPRDPTAQRTLLVLDILHGCTRAERGRGVLITYILARALPRVRASIDGVTEFLGPLRRGVDGLSAHSCRL